MRNTVDDTLLKRTMLSLVCGLYFACGLTGCPSPQRSDTPPAMVAGGGQDGGGGGIKYSTPEQVIAAVKSTRAFLLSDGGQRFVTLAAESADTWESKDQKNRQKDGGELALDPNINFSRVRAILKKVGYPKSETSHAAAPVPYATMSDYLKLSPVRYNLEDTEKKNCSQNRYVAYPDAYVDRFEYGAEVCFNIQRLTRIPEYGLKQHLLALWLHEITHLNGFVDETEASDVETFVLWKTQRINHQQLNSLAGHLFLKTWNLYSSVNQLHKYHVRTEWQKESQARGQFYESTVSFDFKLGKIQEQLQVVRADLEGLQRFQNTFVFHESYSEVFDKLTFLTKLIDRTTSHVSETNLFGQKVDAQSLETLRTSWDEFKKLSYCSTVAAKKFSESVSADGIGSSSAGYEETLKQVDAKLCDEINNALIR